MKLGKKLNRSGFYKLGIHFSPWQHKPNYFGKGKRQGQKVKNGNFVGFYRTGARHYSTVLGRFYQREPLTLISPPSPLSPLGVNPYIHAHNSPTCMTDISGLQTMGMTSQGILYPPEKPEVPPYEPWEISDPGFEPEGVGPKMPDAMSLQIPGICPPWWDRRNPMMPLPDKPPAPGTPAPVPQIPTGPQCMGASSGGAQGFETWYPGTPSWLEWLYGGQHYQKGPIDTGSSPGGPYGYAPMVNVSAGSTKSSVGEQSEEEFNQAWKDQGIGASIVGTVAKWTGYAILAAATITLGAAMLGSTTAASMLSQCPLSQFLARTIGRLFIRRGMTVFRAYSGPAKTAFGKSWTPFNPKFYGRELYSKLAGLGENKATDVVRGILLDTKGVTTKFATPDKVFGTMGGLFEIVIPDAATQVQIIAKFLL